MSDHLFLYAFFVSRSKHGSMQVEFYIEVGRCHLSDELEAQSHYRSRRNGRVSTVNNDTLHTF